MGESLSAESFSNFGLISRELSALLAVAGACEYA